MLGIIDVHIHILPRVYVFCKLRIFCIYVHKFQENIRIFFDAFLSFLENTRLLKMRFFYVYVFIFISTKICVFMRIFNTHFGAMPCN